MKISEILATYDTDKVREHSYGRVYDKLFEDFNQNDKLNILEVGTQKGGSLCAWRDYFPNSSITGIDIVDVVKPEYRRKDIEYVIKDIKDYKSDIVYDIIIDDGSHSLGDVLYVVKNLKYKLLIIEDVQNPESWVNFISVPYSVFDLRHVKGNYDDFLIICS